MWLAGRAVRGTIVANYDGVRVTMRLEHANIQRSAVRRGSQVAIQIRIDAIDQVVEVRGHRIKLSRPATLHALGVVLAARIRHRAQETLAVTERAHIDAFGFGRLIAAYQPQAWRRLQAHWPMAMSTIPVEIQVVGHARNTGNLVNPITVAGG